MKISSLIGEDSLLLALREGSKIGEDKIPANYPEKRALLFLRSDAALQERFFKMGHFRLTFAYFKDPILQRKSNLGNKSARFSR